jgi:hypothetical protein
MHNYRVYDVCAQARTVALRDASGRQHLARITSGMPRLWDELQGDMPALGFSLLLTQTGRVFRAIFEVVNVPRGFTLDIRQPESAHALASFGALIWSGSMNRDCPDGLTHHRDRGETAH